MKFSVVGNNPAAMDVIREIHASREDDFGPFHLAGELAALVAASSIPIHLEDSAEAAILANGVDAVILAVQDTEEILSLTRSATQSDRHVIVVLPNDVSTAFSFELHLLLDECQMAVIPLSGRTRFAELPTESPKHLVNTSDLFQVSQETVIPASQLPGLRSIQAAIVDMLSSTGIRFTQVTAVEANAPSGQLISRSLTFAASATAEQAVPPATILIRVVPQTEDGSWQAAPLKLMYSNGTFAELTPGEPRALARIRYLCKNREQCSHWIEEFSTTMELCDGIDKSLRRKRTVDVYFDSGSERGVFKGMMTAIGCGVLLWTLFGMVVFLIVAKLTSLPGTALEVIRILWIAPLILFLVAQFLLPLARDRSTRG
ncbi:MAG: hypothetical protein JNL58_27420 [Planctomyces sp.]|nr:hypothetical protein [Planctomyces sp.]